MLENLGLVSASLVAMLGAVLLFSGTSSALNENAALSLIGGAAALAGGIIAVVLILKSKLHSRRIERHYRGRT